MSYTTTKSIFLYSSLLIAVVLFTVQINWRTQPLLPSTLVVTDKSTLAPTPASTSISETKSTFISVQAPVPVLVSAPATNLRTDNLIPLQIGSVVMQASVADTPSSLELGLSDTLNLPNGIAKLFIFRTSEKWDFWMKDMNYPIDIIWLDELKKVVYIKHSVEPNTYPNSFVPSVPAKYVIETAAGFALENQIDVDTLAVFQY